MKNPLRKVAMLAFASPLLFMSCATIVSKSSYPVGVDTNPAGATVSITDKKGKEVFRSTSPATAMLKSGAGYFAKAEYQVKISSPGYADMVVPVNYKLNGWYFGNILIGGVLGMLIVDPVSGAMWKLNTPTIDVTLTKATATTQNTGLKIVDIASLPQNMKDKLVRVK